MTSTIAAVRSAVSPIATKTSTLVVIDPGVADYQSLASGVLSGAGVLVLDSEQDGVEQITTALQQHPEITDLHIVAHGSPACLYLGNSKLNLATIDRYAWDLQSWFSSQSPSVSLYACSVAVGEAGSEFLQKLHTFTGASVYASSTPVGNAEQGGNWELDVIQSATISVASKRARGIPFNSTVLTEYQGIFAGGVVISQVYGGAGGTGAVYKNDFVELFNQGNTTVDLSTWSVQYASSTGTTWQVTQLSGVIQPGQYYTHTVGWWYPRINPSYS